MQGRMLERKVDAIMRLALSETEEARAEATAAIRTLQESGPEPADVECIIRAILLDLGVPDRLIGHSYLVTALWLTVKDETLARKVTKQLYPTIAGMHLTTPARVERGIRHAIEAAWDRGDWDKLTEYFGNTVSSNKGRPTNGEFIARVSNEIRSRIQGVQYV